MPAMAVCVLKNDADRQQAGSYRSWATESALKTTSTCTESATAERYRYTPLRSRLCKALIHLGFFPRHMTVAISLQRYESSAFTKTT